MKRVSKNENRRVIGMSVIAMMPFLCTATFAQDGDASAYHFNRNPFVTKSTGPVLQQQTATSSQYRFNGFDIPENRIRVMIESQGKSYRLFVGENRDGVSVKEAKVDGDNKYVVLTVGDETFRLDFVRDSNAGMMNPMPLMPMQSSMPPQMPQMFPPVMDSMNPNTFEQPSPPKQKKHRKRPKTEHPESSNPQ
jgi:hypothetical protein